MQWANYDAICSKYLFFIENERKCSPFQARIRKLKGIKSGVSDLFLAYPSNGYFGFFIEIKRRGGKPTKIQKKWMSDMNQLGYYANWFDNWSDAKLAIENYLYFNI